MTGRRRIQMSKHLLEVLGAMTHPTLMQTVEQCHQGSDANPMALNIRLMSEDEQGNLSSADDTRYVRISDSAGGDRVVPLRLKHGEGYVRLEDICAAQLTIVQCDEAGNQMMNGDRYGIVYVVNDIEQSEDYGRIYHKGEEVQEICIINRPASSICLNIVKVLYNEYHEPMEFSKDMNFTIKIQGCGGMETIDLNEINDYQVTLDHLKAGMYEVCEEEEACWSTMYALDGGKPCTDGTISLEEGAHTLEVINTKRVGSVLTLDQYVRDGNGELIKPQDDACFRVRVIGDYFDKVFELNASNDFAMELCDLPSGLYDVAQLDVYGCDVSYLVNAMPESEYAHVEIKECCSASVLIINSIRTNIQESPLRICKYVRRSDNCLVKPDPCESFKVMLSGCGVCEIFNLNAGNNFCVDIEHICCGEYEVKELDHQDYVASYIVNDGCESTSACINIHECGQNCVTIINEERNKGEVTICKVIRQSDGTLIKPDKSQRFLVTLRSFFARETFVLDASNDFCVHVYRLKEGSYEVKERCVDGYDTSYMINGGKEERKARFVVMNDNCSDIKVINSVKKEQSGDLRICKYIANAYGDYVKPSVDEEFEIHVEGPCVDECFILRSSNNWCIMLEGLKKGVYRILEQSSCRYDTQYFVNGCEMEEAALVCMEQENQDVAIVNTRKSYGNLKLSVQVEECDCERHKPSPTQFFDVIVETKDGSREIRLDERNNFGVLLEELPQGRVRVTQKDSYGYRVMYDVNGTLQSNAAVEMTGENNAIIIVNQMMDCAGVVRVRKLVETLHGRIVKPCAEDCYSFVLHSRCLNTEVTLKEQNEFCVLFDDLEMDDYEIIENCVEGMQTSYRINGEECERGTFVLGQEDVNIDIINKVLPLPRLHVQKRIKHNGCLIKPQCDDVYRFQLIARGVHETYCLNADNDWCVSLEGLCNQHYEIREVDASCHTMYQINDCLSEKGTFLFEHEDIDVTIINEAPSDAVVQITKMMKDISGRIVKPCHDECFEAVLESECYKQCFTLNVDNDWCVAIEGLPCGSYCVSEQNSGCRYEVLIDDCHTHDGCFALDQEDVNVTIINPIGCENVLILSAKRMVEEEEHLPHKDTCYHVHVMHEGICDDFKLDHTNNWCIQLSNICLGEYHIFADEPLLYEACGEYFEHGIYVEMGCGDCVVNLIDEEPCQRDIIIQKRIQDEHGRLHLPPCGSRFDVMLVGCAEECFELNEENNWSVTLCDYPKGSYEVNEVGACHARYQIDDREIKHHGRFQLKNKSVSVTVINPFNDCSEPVDQAGSLTVHALVKNCDGDLETAPQDAAFDVMIDGDGVREDITLTHRNGFQMLYEHLPKGKYQITQTPDTAYTRVMYRINGTEVAKGTVELGKQDVQVDLINYKNCQSGSIRVMKYIKDASCGCLKRPCMEESYDVSIKGKNHTQTVILNASNKWTYVFDHLSDGTYTISEEDGEGVSYIVNGGKEEQKAVVSIAGDEANVKIINPSSDTAHGSIELCKYKKDEQGNLHDPDVNKSYWIIVQNETTTQRVLLHAANHFYAEVRHLLPGTYEVIEEDGQDTLYSVNGGKETNKAMVAVNGNRNSVNVINPVLMKGALRLSKFIEQDTVLQLPTSGSYRIHVSAPGYNKVITLEESNHYTTMLTDLKKGLYVVDELDHDNVTYQIDGGSRVDRAIINVRGSHEVSIINQAQEQAHGTIKMTKYIRSTSGQLKRPTGTQAYQFHVSKPGFNEVYTLNNRNNWSVTLENLQDGNYVLAELHGDTKVSYIINDNSETDFGIVAVKGNDNVVSIINSETSSNGSITITKYIRNQNGDMVRPTGSFSTNVHVSKSGYNEVFTLNQANNWEIKLLDLMDGDYVLCEVDSDDDVTWRINGGYEVRYAIVSVNHNENQVDMIDTQLRSGNTLHLQKFMRNASGQLVKPEEQDQFMILISGAKTMRINLNAQNDWMAHLDQLPDGTYHIKETTSNYDVTYVINDGVEQDEATLVLNKEDATVNVINAMRGSRNMLELSKYIKTSGGGMIPPVSGDRFQVEVSGMAFQETYTLSESNSFTQRVTNLPSGTYTVRELGAQDYTTTYRVNGGQETTSAMVSVSEGKNNVVEILNERNFDQNIVDVYKYMMDAQGNFNKPEASQVFRFLLTGSNVHQFYTLSSANDWHVQIDTLASGEYEIIEQSNGRYDVQYLVNGTDFSSTAEFVASAGNQTIVEIVNRNQTQNNGKIELEKKIRNAEGDLVIPGNGESFSIRVFNEEANYDEIFTLDELNAYTLAIPSLTYGTYNVEEIDNSGYGVTYIVNDEGETSSAQVNVQSAALQRVLIINTQTSLFFHVARNDDLHIVIE